MDDQIGVPNNLGMDLMSSLFGQHIGSEIFNQNPKINDTNYTCPHPVFLGKVCTRCGLEISVSKKFSRTVPLWYIYSNLSVSVQEINRIRDENLQSLLSRRKIHLILDLDHTLLHKRCRLTPEDKKYLRSKKHGIDHDLPEGGTLFKLSDGWIKLRPYVRTFLEEASTMFDMTIYTLSSRFSVRTVVKLLDPNGVYLDNWRVITRDDIIMLDKHKKCLDNVLEHERVTLVLDDNEEVWDRYKVNCLKVTPYNFFSYFSPDENEHDASPSRQSWSQLNSDESEENGVLAKLLVKLRTIHAAFYDDDFGGEKDVRQILQRVQMAEMSVKKKNHQKENKKKNGR